MIVCQQCFEICKQTTPTQVYCSAKCSREATKKRRKERIRLEKIKQRMKQVRFCSNNCGARLSAYNEGTVCMKCSVDEGSVSSAIESLRDFFEFEDKSE